MFKKGIKMMFVCFSDERKLRIFFLLNVRIYEKLKGGKSDYTGLEKDSQCYPNKSQKL
jgi:hypothetical protein